MENLGFTIHEDVLSGSECEMLEGAVDHRDLQRRAGARNLMSNDVVASLAYGHRLMRLAGQTLGRLAVPYRGTLFDKSRNSNWHVLWHQDRALPLTRRLDLSECGPWSTRAGVLYALAPAWALERVVALRVHIDSSTEDNGPLQVIPGSHKAGVLDQASILRAVAENSPRTCVVGRGGVVSVRPLLLHSSRKARSDQRRRVLHIEYASDLDFGGELRLRVA
jgi:hypothetical protein